MFLFYVILTFNHIFRESLFYKFRKSSWFPNESDIGQCVGSCEANTRNLSANHTRLQVKLVTFTLGFIFNNTKF